MAQEISFEQAMGTAPQPANANTPAAPGNVSFEEAQNQTAGSAPTPPSQGFLARSLKKVGEAGSSVVNHPLDSGLGAVKSIAGGVVSMADLSAQGLSGIATAAVGKGFNTGQEAAAQFTQKVKDVTSAVTKLNLTPDGKDEEAMANLLGVIPDGIQSAGDTVFEKTGSALAGAGTQALLTLLSITGLKAGKVMDVVRGKGKAADIVKGSVDEMAVKDPASATAIADHIRPTHPEAAEAIDKSVAKHEDASPEKQEIIGKDAAKTKIADKPRVRITGTTEDGKPRIQIVTPESLSADVRDSLREGYDALKKPAIPDVKPAPTDDPVMYVDAGKPVTLGTIQSAFKIADVATDKIPGVGIVKGKLTAYYDEIIRTINPEALGPSAKAGAAILAKNIAVQMQRDSSFYHRAQERRTFWNYRAPEARSFIAGYEKGERFSDPVLRDVATGYKEWNDQIHSQDIVNKLKYEPEDNYLYHSFEDSEGVNAHMTRKYGAKWGDPGFTKERTFSMYEEAIKAGFKPRFTNPEDIMLTRQHASDIAQMRVHTLNDLETYGLAKKIGKGETAAPDGFPSAEWRSPTGDRYWVDADAAAVLHNAFNTKSLWSMKGMAGDAFRGAMFLKNSLVPIKLAFSLFHPIHVATIDNATGMVRASKELLSGTISPAKWMGKMVAAAAYKDFFSNPKGGYKMLKAFQGRIKDGDLGTGDRTSLQYMAEGGFVPEISNQYKTNAIMKLKDAVAQRKLSTVWHLPFAALESLQKPMFEIWIPSLKTASYLKDVTTALKTNPKLLDDPLGRQMAFRKLAKSVDNRYGEMAYGTLFWNRWVKDLAVANTLSLGWQLGFLREYGGGALEMSKAVGGKIGDKARTGNLDRALFVSFYTAQALAYGGLLTYAMTGKAPNGLMDYIYPKSGDQTADGKDRRVTTMFYPREFAAITKHMQNEGVIEGLDKTVTNKASGVVGLVREWASGVNDFGQEIRDPDAPAYKQLEQTLSNTFKDLLPITYTAASKEDGDNSGRNKALDVAGFSQAPKYVTDTKTEAAIKGTYEKYYAPKQTPFERAQYSQEARTAKTAYDKGDMETFDTTLDNMEDKYELSPGEVRKLQTQMEKGTGDDPTLKMFGRLTWQQQKKILDGMTPEEREIYLPKSNKTHLRYAYDPPEGK